MKDRINQFLMREGISPAEFADKIGVQRSSVSHVLNGRNYPSASFIQKMLGSYKTLNPRWLLLGEGTMLDTIIERAKEPTLFQIHADDGAPLTPRANPIAVENLAKEIKTQLSDPYTNKPSSAANLNPDQGLNQPDAIPDFVSALADIKEVERIVLFFKDKTFTAYTPSK